MTRPRAASDRFVASLPADLVAQVAVILSPVMEIAPRPMGHLPDHAGVILTSQAAVAVAAAGMPDRAAPAYCVGRATTAAARAAGWQAQEMGPDADALVTAMIARRPAGPFVHLRGGHTRGEVAARLTAAGLRCDDYVIYDQPARPLTPEAAQALAGRCCVAPVFSPRSAALLAERMVGDGRDLHLLALSPAVAAALSPVAHASLHVCAAPNATEMQKLVSETLRPLLHRSKVP